MIVAHVGDCRDVLKTLPAESVHCVVSSPPYYGLRNYGVAGQIGLEPTIEEYVAEMVGVFREVRRVLRRDGTLWLNLASSYASGDMNPSPSRLLQRVPAYGSDGTALRDCPNPDYACFDHGDGRQVGKPIRHARNARNDQSASQDVLRPLQTDHDNAPMDCVAELPGASGRVSLVSTTPESSFQPLGVSSPSAKVSAFRDKPPTFVPASHSSERSLACTTDIAPMSPPLVVRTSGKESFFSACGRSDCKGIGRCGLCWCSLAIPSLDIKQKDEINVPHLVAMALQADGWTLRQTICWSKPNPMPESVTDRCTKAHESIFLLTKSARYFYDAEAVKEKSVIGEGAVRNITPRNKGQDSSRKDGDRFRVINDGSRNKRSVWTVATEPFEEAHFATFPPALIEPCILAGTSAKGCCAKCGAPWEREIERQSLRQRADEAGTWAERPKAAAYCDAAGSTQQRDRTSGLGPSNSHNSSTPTSPVIKTLGWRATCKCDAAAVPCTVLDPFGGAGTTGLVADRLQRNAVLIELNPIYTAMAKQRIADDAPLFSSITVK